MTSGKRLRDANIGIPIQITVFLYHVNVAPQLKYTARIVVYFSRIFVDVVKWLECQVGLMLDGRIND